VQCFRSVNGAWQPAGQSGCVIVGGPAASAFQIVLYEPASKRPFSITNIVPTLQLQCADSQYINFSDDQSNAWSTFFETKMEASLFLQHATLVRAAIAAAAAEGSVPLITQDVLAPADGAAAAAGDLIGVRLAGWAQPPALRPCSGSPLVEKVDSGGDEAKPLRCTLPLPGGRPSRAWEEGLGGMRKGASRIA
jgi:hypothetical protein